MSTRHMYKTIIWQVKLVLLMKCVTELKFGCTKNKAMKNKRANVMLFHFVTILKHDT